MTFKKNHVPWNKGKKLPKGYKHTTSAKKKMSDARKKQSPPTLGKKLPKSKATKKKISDSLKGNIPWNKDKKTGQKTWMKGKKHTKDAKQKNADAHKGKKRSEISCRNQSATKQGIPYDEWESFACEKKYCPKFDEACRESCRAKYNYECFVCGLPQSENKTKTGKVRKLSVHHVDMSKSQGCDSNWKLVPLCMHHHATSHNDELIARLGYLIKENKK